MRVRDGRYTTAGPCVRSGASSKGCRNINGGGRGVRGFRAPALGHRDRGLTKSMFFAIYGQQRPTPCLPRTQHRMCSDNVVLPFRTWGSWAGLEFGFWNEGGLSAHDRTSNNLLLLCVTTASDLMIQTSRVCHVKRRRAAVQIRHSTSLALRALTARHRSSQASERKRPCGRSHC
jgi:hypothetical protein